MTPRNNGRPPSRSLGGGMAKALNGAPGSNSIRSGRIAAARALNSSNASSFSTSFFPPGQPLPPMAPASTAGRAFDYQVGQNLIYGNRSQSGVTNISFATLRRLADPAQGGLDLLRAAIEKRKKEMKGQRFTIIGREKNDDGGPRAKAALEFFRKPDGVTRWRAWLGKFLEDHFVIDAPTVYFQPDLRRGALLEIVDGSTIDLLIDGRGRTPAPPYPAYQQILKGLPAVDYTTEEIGYYAYNLRSDRIYGMSQVEQVATIVTIALNRQLSVLNYFTEGSVPDMLVGVPQTWNPEQIAQYQVWWESQLSGQLGERRKVRFIPGETKPYETKTEILKNDFDEWIARVVCFCFDLSPEALVKQTNRATAQTGHQSALEQGLEPTKIFVKDAADDMLERLGAPDLQLQWIDEEITDPVQKATVAVMLRGGTTGTARAILTLDETRDMLSLPPLTPAQRDELEPEPPPDASNGNSGNNPPDDSAAKRRGGRLLPAVPPNRKLDTRTRRAINKAVRAAFTAQRKAVVSAIRVRGDSTKLAKQAHVSLEDIHAALDALELNPWDESVRQALRELLAAYAAERSTAALDYIEPYMNTSDEDYARLLVQANAEAVAWSEQRAANLVVDVSDATRKGINELTASAIDRGITNAELATELENFYGFSAERSTLIARTETAFADVAGSMIGYRASGVVNGKAWDPDAEACPICLDNAAAGDIPLELPFPSGDDAPPAHPRCECSILPVVDVEDPTAEEA